MKREKEVIRALKEEILGKGLLSEKAFQEVVEKSERDRKSVVEILYELDQIEEKDIVSALSRIFGYPPINVNTFVIDGEILRLIPKDLAVKYKVLPITRHENTLTVAIKDPTNLQMLDDLRVLAGLRIKPALAVPSQLGKALENYYANGGGELVVGSMESFNEIIDEVKDTVLKQTITAGSGDSSDLMELANATPVVRMVNQLLIEAIRKRASDVFVEPLEKSMRVRYRVDGSLEQVLRAPKNFVGPVISRIKVMSRLNIAEHRIPQDGRFKARMVGPEVDLRVSILPTCYGEKACLRILDPSSEMQRLDQLGFGGRDLEIVQHSASKPHGLILLTGPTGSGKTTTLYAMLQYINSPEKNITTVEDPVEYQMPGINQVNVRDQVGLTFPIVLRSILRQDPDVLLIGEIRDQVTMDIAVKSALTGHLVLSTLHTNDATSAVVRMINMGVEPFLIASSVLMISAQRLVRKLCSVCRTPYSPDSEVRELLELPPNEEFKFYRSNGCDHCRFSGYKGRTVITELFEVKSAILDLIVKGGNNEELRRLVRETGMRTLRECGIAKVKEGITAVEEVLRVTNAENKPTPQEV